MFYWLISQQMSLISTLEVLCNCALQIDIYLLQLRTRCSAIAARPRCRVHYSFRQK